MTCYFTAALMASLLWKYCPRSPSFIVPHRGKWEGAKFRWYSGCGRTVQPWLAMCFSLQTIVWLAIIMLQEEGCCLLRSDSENLSLQLSQRSSVVVGLGGLSMFQKIQKDDHISIPNDNVHHFTHWGLHFYLGNSCADSPWTAILTLAPLLTHVVTGNDAIPEIVTFSLFLVQYVLTNLHTVFFLF